MTRFRFLLLLCSPMLPADPPLPLLITGLAGVAGYNAFQFLRAKYGEQVLAIRRTDYWPLSGPGIIPCDMDDRDAMRRLFDKYQFAAVLHCEGTCKLKSCELDPVMARRINVQSMEVLLETIAGSSVRLLHLSIDLVFSGTRGGNHREDDEVDPVTIYGKTMVEAEQLIARERPSATLLRISLPMGVSFNGHAGAIDWIQSRFKKQKPATLYFDERRTPTYTDCLSPLLLDVLRRPELTGLYHAGGPRSLSLYEIAQVVNRVGGYRPDDLMGCLRIEAGPLPPRAGDVSMNSSKLVSLLGYQPFDGWPYHSEFVPTHPDWHRDRPGEPGSPELLAEVLYRNPGRKF
ncbi:NAD(P)-dependent oxidoreductase [Anatilimnocola sp. NA78]|uniref:SDR family oxidoreductase n=1 Tax=Anatilimnocola sp. NA78 TaxID=3415683 RepID=UPI003CE485A5